ncbi:glycosyltransferase family 4 protein [Gammaproteobacteria bacterium]|nr:glycosyltransferase family 4 protein [Gammaproteobacteria bacterium]
MTLTVVQVLPALEVGGVERGTLEIASGLVKAGHRSIVISGGGRLVDTLVLEGSQHFNWTIGKKSLFTFILAIKLRKLLIRESVDILHVRSRMPAWVCYLALRSIKENKRPRFICTVHGPYSVNRYSKIMTKGDDVIVISEFIKDYVLDNYTETAEEKLSIIHRGVDAKEFPYNYSPNDSWIKEWNKNYASLKDKFIITLPARITRWKGQEDFLLIISALKKLGVPIHGLIAGGAHIRRIKFLKSLKKQVIELGLENEIDFIGHRDDLKEIMAISDIVLSLAKKPEAFGRTALESLSLGTPVVAYDHGGASEVLNTLFPCGLTPNNNIANATKKIASLYKTSTTISMKNPFTRQAMIEKTIKLYEKSVIK